MGGDYNPHDLFCGDWIYYLQSMSGLKLLVGLDISWKNLSLTKKLNFCRTRWLNPVITTYLGGGDLEDHNSSHRQKVCGTPS
jgi:hypothetical protein